MSGIRVAIAGGSGYVGGELVRLLGQHAHVTVAQVSSERFAGRPVAQLHPNLRRVCGLDFCAPGELQACDVLFLCLPHGRAMREIERYRALAPRLVDLSADFRLKRAEDYRLWYGVEHPHPELLGRFVYGIPELHREELREASLVSSAGCNATAAILALQPLYKHGLAQPSATVVEAKVGSSEGGNSVSEASHHPERSGCVRSYKPTGHRHVAEMIQELGGGIQIHFSATAVEMVRGVLVTCHVFLERALENKDVWQLYRREYGAEPFIRIVKEREGTHRYPEPKLLAGSNYCDIGFELDPHSRRLVVMGALDNLMKGAAGQAVQAFNIMHSLPETTGLEFPGLHPV
jgi:N-acetyl-gamma-glutamyl-phosphate/LysW-gamma-L-alpha-aminoadipyl-6-phosphate reductase